MVIAPTRNGEANDAGGRGVVWGCGGVRIVCVMGRAVGQRRGRQSARARLCAADEAAASLEDAAIVDERVLSAAGSVRTSRGNVHAHAHRARNNTRCASVHLVRQRAQQRAACARRGCSSPSPPSPPPPGCGSCGRGVRTCEHSGVSATLWQRVICVAQWRAVHSGVMCSTPLASAHERILETATNAARLSRPRQPIRPPAHTTALAPTKRARRRAWRSTSSRRVACPSRTFRSRYRPLGSYRGLYLGAPECGDTRRAGALQGVVGRRAQVRHMRIYTIAQVSMRAYVHVQHNCATQPTLPRYQWFEALSKRPSSSCEMDSSFDWATAMVANTSCGQASRARSHMYARSYCPLPIARPVVA